MTQHKLTTQEKLLSGMYSNTLGLSVMVYRDGNWIADARSLVHIGYGDTPEKAIKDLQIKNEKK